MLGQVKGQYQQILGDGCGPGIMLVGGELYAAAFCLVLLLASVVFATLKVSAFLRTNKSASTKKK